jgi:hypothetical protein
MATGLRGKLGEPIDAPDSIPLQISPFTLSIAPPAPTVLANYWVPLQFSALPLGDSTVVSGFVHVQAAGADVPFKLVPSFDDPTLVFVQPADSISFWPPGVVIDVTVDAGLPDAFNVPLGMGQAVSFTACVTADCAPIDAGATPDGGATDSAGGDAPASD